VKRNERMTAVLELLAETGRVEVEEIVTKLQVSPATARRDLDALADQLLLTRTRGGAVSQSVAYDLPIRYKRDQRASAKQRIARAASGLVPRGAVIGLSGGTTSTAIATALISRADLAGDPADPPLTVVTNAINIAAELVMRPQIKTVVTGGVVRPRSYELVGPYTDVILQRLTLDLAFVGVNGVDPEFGATVHDEGEAAANSALASRAARAVIVADSSKIGHRAFATLDEGVFRTLLTDPGISDSARAAFADRGVEVIVA
jgi:DeoR family transcriptional regulator of aga operon